MGGRLFPGRHHGANFDVRETSTELHVAYISRDRSTEVSVDVRVAESLQGSALFGSLEQASLFFQQGSAGFSPDRDGARLDGIELSAESWRVEPVDVRAVRSTFFDDEVRFPPGIVALDCALLMRQVPVTWNPIRPHLAAEAGRPDSARELVLGRYLLAMRADECRQPGIVAVITAATRDG